MARKKKNDTAIGVLTIICVLSVFGYYIGNVVGACIGGGIGLALLIWIMCSSTKTNQERAYKPAGNSKAPFEPATEKQIDYITDLGGHVGQNLSKSDASRLIQSLLDKVPPTSNQIRKIKSLNPNAKIPQSKTKAVELIGQLELVAPPTKAQIKEIESLNDKAAIPKTRPEAVELIEQLKQVVPAIQSQHDRASKLGSVIPEGSTFNQAEDIIEEKEISIKAYQLGLTLPEGATFEDAYQLIEDKENDLDPEDGKPPTKPQLTRITKLGGDPSTVKNRWRAEQYIEELEEKREDYESERDEWADDVLAMHFSRDCLLDRYTMKKPSKAVLKKVYDYAKEMEYEDLWEEIESDLEEAVEYVETQSKKG